MNSIYSFNGTFLQSASKGDEKILKIGCKATRMGFEDRGLETPVLNITMILYVSHWRSETNFQCDC